MDTAKETLSSVQQKASETVGQVQDTLSGSVSPLSPSDAFSCCDLARCMPSRCASVSPAIWGWSEKAAMTHRFYLGCLCDLMHLHDLLGVS